METMTGRKVVKGVSVIIVLLWFSIIGIAFIFTPRLFDNLTAKYESPKGTPSYDAQILMKREFPSVSSSTSIAVYIEEIPPLGECTGNFFIALGLGIGFGC